MSWLQSIAQEIYGLFVDDGSFAIAILLWLAAVVLVLPRFAQGARWEGPAFFVGLAVILVESVLRFSRRRTK
jgi:hypothetical protein